MWQKKLWIVAINLNKNMYIMMKLNKYTPNIQSYTFEMESWTMIFNLHENSIMLFNIISFEDVLEGLNT